jgi:hypothetical protein
MPTPWIRDENHDLNIKMANKFIVFKLKALLIENEG